MKTISALVMVAVGCRNDTTRSLEDTIRGNPVEWKLTAPAWQRIVVEPYRQYYAAYAQAFDADVPVTVAPRAAIAVRRHYADDPTLTVGQAFTRWALPVLAESYVAIADGAPIDAVFVRDDNRWYAIAGLDRVIRDRVAHYDPTCAARMIGSAPLCRQVAWSIADGALRGLAAEVAHGCGLAVTHCGKPSP